MADGAGLGARGLTDQQRRFADFVLEGKTQIEAHRLAGYKGKTDNARAASASEILRNPNVILYMEERRVNASSKAEVTLEWLIEQAKDVLVAAKGDASHAAAIAAIKELGVLSGKRIETRHNLNQDADEPTDLSRAELLDIARAGRSRIAPQGDSAGKPDRVHKVH